ncbi:La-related protein 1B [Striga hermonthica]|uniref:La-related protein 1B n=1 Tax=Striga hermonthica TaxID=68872 RepID=A0A9N7R5G3_STRHE|nr:La-related protein 1B [Striga hermonthica]
MLDLLDGGLLDLDDSSDCTENPHPPTAASNGGVDCPRLGLQRQPSPWARLDQIQFPTAMASAVSVQQPELAPPSDEFVNGSSGSEAQPEGSDVSGDGSAGHPRRPAWNRPINGDVEGVSVMGGAISWPALSESTRPSSRSLSDSTRPMSDGSAPPYQAPPLLSQPPQRQVNPHSHANSSANNTSRARSRNRGGGPSHNNFGRPSPPAPPLFPVFRPMVDTGANQGAGTAPRTPSRRGHNYGPRPRGDGPHHNNYGGRRHQDRRGANFSPPSYMPQHSPMSYMPPPLPPGVPPFIGPPPVRVFPGQMGFEMTSPFVYVPSPPLGPESFRAMPVVPPPMPMLFPPANENTLTNMIVKQIDYYFSDDNLAKDNYLRSKMDDQGWVPITLIASFHRVEQLTKNVKVILDALKHSTVVELQGEKIRRHGTWQKWLHSSSRRNTGAGGAVDV